jgi:hypothetical protein
MDIAFESRRDFSMARLLISVNFREWIPKEVILDGRIQIYIHPIEYEGLSFRCRHCHELGHLVKDFSLPFVETYFKFCNLKTEAFLFRVSFFQEEQPSLSFPKIRYRNPDRFYSNNNKKKKIRLKKKGFLRLGVY